MNPKRTHYAIWISAADLRAAISALEGAARSFMHRPLGVDEMEACERVIHALHALRNAEIVEAEFDEVAVRR
jgi:hypothetical protein